MPLGLFSGACLPWGNWMEARGDAPFKLGGVTSSLWKQDQHSEPSTGFGWGYLLMTSAELGCDEFLQTDVESADWLWDESGLYVSMRWNHNEFDSLSGQELGWEGEYYQVLDVDIYQESGVLTRWFSSLIFSDGFLYDSSGDQGWARIDSYGLQVTGKVETSLYKARFNAEECGQEGSDDQYDPW